MGKWYTIGALEYPAKLGRICSAPPRWSQPQGDRLKKIFVGNLDFGVAEESIREQFEKFGAVERIDVVKDRDTGQPRGFAFVEMTDGAEADRAIAELNGAILGSRAINVNEARPKGAGGSSGGFRRQGGGPPRQRREPRW